MNNAVCTFVAALLAAAIPAPAQRPATDALKRPIAEAGLVETLEPVAAGEIAPAATAVLNAPRATAVTPRTAVAEPAATPERKAKGATEITAMEATFDNKKHEAVFTHNVTVNDPEFSVTCDRLIAMLRHEGSANNVKPTEKSPAAAPKPEGKKKGGLERAIAEGNVVIKQAKTEADGSTSYSYGKAQKADYNAITGDIVLSGMPIVQQGMNQCISTSAETVMTLNRDRNMKVVGPHRTIISDKADLEK